MNFGQALEALKGGKRVSREGWNGKGMFIVLIPGESVTPSIDDFPLQPCIALKTAANQLQPGWNASQADMLAEDWSEVNE